MNRKSTSLLSRHQHLTTVAHVPKEIYLAAKEKALLLLQEIDIYEHMTTLGYQQTVSKITRMVSNCLPQEQGQIFLILCQTAVKLKVTIGSLLLPKQFFINILAFLNKLADEKKPKFEEKTKLTRQTYAGIKVKNNKIVRNETKNDKKRLLEMFVIDRIDIVLRQIMGQLNQKQKCKVKLCKDFILFIQGIVTFPIRHLLEEEKKHFRQNVSRILDFIDISQDLMIEPKKVESNMIIIDQSYDTNTQNPFALKSSDANKLLNIYRNNIKNSTQKGTSIYDSIESIRNRQISIQRKSSSILRKTKRGSISSNCGSKRSSILYKNDETSARVSTRWNNKFNVNQVIANSLNRNRTARASNFQQIRPRDYQALMKDEIPKFQKNASIIEEEFNNADRQQIDFAINSVIVDQLFQIMKNIKPFYVFLKRKQTVYLLTIKQIKKKQTDCLQTNDETIRIKIINLDLFINEQMLVDCQNQKDQKQQKCLKSIINKIYCFWNDKNWMKIQIKPEQQINYNNFVNMVAIQQPKYCILMGFVRKVSTYFANIIIYSRKCQDQDIYERGFKRRMFSGGLLKGQSIDINIRLMNTDLSITYQQQSYKVLKGGIFSYIQVEDDQQKIHVSSNQGFKLTIDHSSLKQCEDVTFQNIWWSDYYILEVQKNNQKINKKDTFNKMQKMFQDKQINNKKLKRTVTNKNSFKMVNNDFINPSFQSELFKTFQSKNNSRKDFGISQKVLSLQHNFKSLKSKDGIGRKLAVRKGQKQYIQTIKTDHGYKLMMHKQKEYLSGLKYQQYYGFLQNNPQNRAYWKNQSTQQTGGRQFYLKSPMSIHGKNKKQIQNTCLITFVKGLRTDQGFAGYIVSSIKILSDQNNSWIFIQSYWEKMQKYFIFILSSEVFQKLSQINTHNFQEKPFLANTTTKKAHARKTSMILSLKLKESEIFRANTNKSKKFRQHDDDCIEEGHNTVLDPHIKSRFNDLNSAATQMQTFNRGLKTMDTCSTSKNMKNSQRNVLKKEVTTRLKNKVIKFSSFCWRKHTLFFQLKYPSPTQLDSPSILQFQGSQVAVKNIYFKNGQTKIADATELILIRYKQSNLANLSSFNIEGLHKIYLQHTFIKNNNDLYGRYSSTMHLMDLDINIDYKFNNKFFENKNKYQELREQQSKTFSLRTSGRQDQRKYKYQQIIQLAKYCILSYQDLKGKKEKEALKVFLIPNRSCCLSSSELILKVQIKQQIIKLTNLNGDYQQILEKDKLQYYFPYIRKMGLRNLKRLLIERILKDEDVIRMCLNRTNQ